MRLARALRRVGLSVGAALAVGAGSVFGAFTETVAPVGYLTRPLAAVSLVAVVVGVMSLVFRRWAVVVSVFSMVWLIQPGSGLALAVAIGVAVLIGLRLLRGFVHIDRPLGVAVGVFLVTGVVSVAPLVSWSPPARAATDADDPVFLILLDGYPRADTLAEIDVDISEFIGALEKRGFDYYPTATSHHAWTYRTLTYMTTGEPMAEDDYGTVSDRRGAREKWRLPDGFAAVAPPIGVATFPEARTLNPGGPTLFEGELLRESAVGNFAGEHVYDGFRWQLKRALAILATTDESHVFAHLLAPHTPFLYDGQSETVPVCWPQCVTVEVRNTARGVTVAEWADGISGYLDWLNPRLVSVVDEIIARHPNAEIVLFSDHGGRFHPEDPAEWHATFLAARTPDDVFEESPHPRSVFGVYSSSSSADRNPGTGNSQSDRGDS